MKKILMVLGAFIALSGIKAIAWIARYGVPKTWRPSTTEDKIGLAYVSALLVAFFLCLAWYLFKRKRK